MTFLLAAIAVTVSGWALLRALGLEEERGAVNLPLSWFTGSAWVGFSTYVLRAFVAAPPAATTAVALALPLAGWAGAAAWRGRAGSPPASREGPESEAPSAARWAPRPAWLFAPMAAWVLVAAAAVSLHGLNTPVHTDDSYRVRALAPVLASTGAWDPAARAVLTMAGPVPAYVPAVAWSLGAAVDPVHVSASIVITFLAFLALLVSLASSRGAPEAGWGAAFAVTSMPLFLYHAASTYSDVWLAMALAAGFAYMASFGRGGDPRDAARALVLLLGAALVKREGEMVALPTVAVLLAQVAWRERRTPMPTLRRLAPLAVAYLPVVLARVRTAGWEGAYPFLHAAAGKVAAGDATAPVASAGSPVGASPVAVFLGSLFTDGNQGILWWVVVVAGVLLAPRIRQARLGWPLAALAIVFAETALNAVWLYPQFTLNHGTVNRSLLPVSAMAAVWVAALVSAGTYAAPAPPSMAASRSTSKG